MGHNDIYGKVHHYVTKELLGGDGEGLSGSTRLLETGIVDSMAIVDLIAFVERELDVVIPDLDVNAANFATLDSVVELVLRLQATRLHPAA